MSKQIPHRVNTTATKTLCNDVTALIADFENIWDKIFKNGPRIICRRQPYHFRFFKSCLPQIFTWPIFEYFAYFTR